MKKQTKYTLSTFLILVTLYILAKLMIIPGATPPEVYYSGMDFLYPFIVGCIYILFLIVGLLLKRDNKYLSRGILLSFISFIVGASGFLIFSELSIGPIHFPQLIGREAGEGIGLLLILLGLILFSIGTLLIIMGTFISNKNIKKS